MKIEQIQKNQLFVTDDQGNQFFQSYDSIIARRDPAGVVTLDQRFWDYSMTTSKYRNQFLGETKKETEKKIKAGVYRLDNLN